LSAAGAGEHLVTAQAVKRYLGSKTRKSQIDRGKKGSEINSCASTDWMEGFKGMGTAFEQMSKVPVRVHRGGPKC